MGDGARCRAPSSWAPAVTRRAASPLPTCFPLAVAPRLTFSSVETAQKHYLCPGQVQSLSRSQDKADFTSSPPHVF